jgi:hypothetical protein
MDLLQEDSPPFDRFRPTIGVNASSIDEASSPQP